jgi:hypothetical protein
MAMSMAMAMEKEAGRELQSNLSPAPSWRLLTKIDNFILPDDDDYEAEYSDE